MQKGRVDSRVGSLRRMAIALFAATLLFGAAVVGLHRLLQEPAVYDMVSGYVKTSEKVEHSDGSWTKVRVAKPFEAVSDSGLLSWDADIYNLLRRYLYDQKYTWSGYFAFFPLFPVVWKVSHMGSVGISVLNWVLFSIGLLLVAVIFGKGLPRWAYPLLLCAPYLVIYMIPYSEALFFLCIAVGLYGLARDRYWVYFVGFFLACTTRAASSILLVAWVVVDVLALLNSRGGLLRFGRDLLRHLGPVVLGVLAVVVAQRLCGAEHWFEYVLAQEHWGKQLSWPTWPLTDWCDESASVTQPLLFMLVVPALVWLALQLWRGVRVEKPQPLDTMAQLRLLSVLFFVGNVLLALFTQKGCMYSQARLLTCTPFFAFLVLDMTRRPIPHVWRWGMLAALLVAIVLCIRMFSRLDMLGSWIVVLLAVVVFFGHLLQPWLRRTLTAIVLLLNLFWTAYLMNCFLIGDFVFT